MEIPFFRYQHVFQGHRESLEHTILRVAEAGAFILQHELREFEDRIASYCGARFVVGVGNATDGLELILRVVGVGAGDEVLLPSHTFVASASPVVMAGAKPVFVEVGADHLMDPDDLEHRVTAHTRAIMPTQLNGRTADMHRIGAVAQRHDLKVVEDSAQGLGSRFCGRMAGTFGVAGVYSFYPAKVLGCLGDGGVVVTNDEVMAETVRELRDHGRRGPAGEVVRWGRNTRLDNIQAAVLLAKLDTLEDEISRRRELAAQYHERLHEIPNVQLPPPPEDAQDLAHYDVFQNYEIEAEDRDALRTFLAERGVGTILQWGGKGIHQFRALGVEQSLPRTEAVLARSFLLPMNTSLTDEELQYVCDRIVEFYERRR